MTTPSDGGRPSVRAETRDEIQHELGSSLTILKGYLRMLADERAGGLNDEQTGFVREAQRQVDRICGLAEDLRADSLAPIAAARVRRVELSELLAVAAQSLLPMLEERALAVVLEIDPELPALPLDATRFEQVVTNLLSNALELAPKASAIRVRAFERSGHAEISVCDEGPGFAADEVEGVFLPYVRGRGAGRVPGRGLGLAICRSIVEAHGGVIEAVVDPAGGHVRVRLPIERGESGV